MSTSSLRRAAATAWALALLLVAAPAATASMHGVQLRWAPSANPGVAGYRIYARLLSGTYGAPTDVGRPAAGLDGTLSWVLDPLDTAASHAFAVTAYMSSGTESSLSNELNLVAGPGAACQADADCADGDACTVNERCAAGTCTSDPLVCADAGACTAGTCDPTAGCAVVVLADGSACDTGDPCEVGTCAAGACTPAAANPAERGKSHYLSVSKFVVRAAGHRDRVLGKASFELRAGFDPAETGAAVELHGDGGRVLYTASVPGSALRRHGRHGGLRYRSTGRTKAGAGGLSRLALKPGGEVVDVIMAASVAQDAAVGTQTRLTWVLRLGDECVRDTGLVCAQRHRTMTCN